MKNVANIQELFKLSEDKLASILGNAASAKQLREFIHMDSKKLTKAQTSVKSKRWQRIFDLIKVYLEITLLFGVVMCRPWCLQVQWQQ